MNFLIKKNNSFSMSKTKIILSIITLFTLISIDCNAQVDLVNDEFPEAK